MLFKQLKLFFIFAILGYSFISCSNEVSEVSNDTENLEETTIINVGLYPYLFEKYEEKSQLVLREMWKAKYPNVQLNFVKYNSYKTSPPDSIDVFVMDAIYLSSFAEKGWILPVDKNLIDDKEDIFPHSLEGCLYKNQYFGIPQFGCANILYYRKDDEEIKNCKTLAYLYELLGPAAYEMEKPPKGENLLIDLSSGTSNICWYIESVMDKTGDYTTSPRLVPPDSINEEALDNVKKLVAMGGKKQSREWLPDRATWFSNGVGRCYVGFTENMSQMEQTNLDNIAMKLVPSYQNTDIGFFFMDAAVINSAIGELPEKKKLATELINLIASSEHMTKSCENGDNAFYYMPSRRSIFEKLKTQYPKYTEMLKLIEDSNPKTLRLGKNAFDKCNSDYKEKIETLIFD